MLGLHPDGIDGRRFMRKNVPAHCPEWIRRTELPKEDGTVTHVPVDTAGTLVHLAWPGLPHASPLAVPGPAGVRGVRRPTGPA